MIKPMNIITGWKNLLLGINTDLAKERAKHCTACDFAKMGVFEKITPENKIVEIKGLVCSKCTCPLSPKLRTDNEFCPIKKW